jgi:hypothetical protein
VCDEVLLHQLLKNLVAEMLTSITNDCSRCTKTSKYSVFQKFDHNSVIIGLACNSFHLLGHIVHNNQDVQKAKGVWEWSHEIIASHVENLNNQNGIEGHHIPLSNTPYLLTALTRCAISMSVSKHGMPIKSTLQNLCSGLICTKMASTSMIMTKGDDIGLVILRYTPPNDPVRTILKQIKIILEKSLNHGQKFDLILSPGTKIWCTNLFVLAIVQTIIRIAFAQVRVRIRREPCVFKINFNSRLMLS